VRHNRDDGAGLRFLAASESLQSSFKLLKIESAIGQCRLRGRDAVRWTVAHVWRRFWRAPRWCSRGHKLKAARPGFDLHIGAWARNMKPQSRKDGQPPPKRN